MKLWLAAAIQGEQVQGYVPRRRISGTPVPYGQYPVVIHTRGKDHGVWSLTSRQQVAKAAARVNAMVGVPRKTHTYLDTEMFLPLDKAPIRPRLQHCIKAWFPYTRRDMDKLEWVQWRVTNLSLSSQSVPSYPKINGCLTMGWQRWKSGESEGTWLKHITYSMEKI